MEVHEQLLIGGEWIPARTGSRLTTVDPASGEPLGTVADAGVDDVAVAVEAATRAFHDPAWRDFTPAARARLLWRMAELIETNTEEIARLETSDQGQPYGIAANVSVPFAAEVFRYYAGWCTKIEGSVAPVSLPSSLFYTRREPVGVCALITPWNFPFMTGAWKIAPALATGNTVILKPAEQTPLSSLWLGRIAEEAGVPPGVVNVLTGGPDAGKALVAHDGVRMVSFTGSTEVGKAIVAASSGNLKRVSLELGGKAPSIIARDADLAKAVPGNLQGALLNSGQVCKAYTRFFAHRSIADEFAAQLAGAASTLRLGPGLAEGTDLGPLVSAEHLARVEQYVQVGLSEGARLVGGGKRPTDLAGFFYQPTVFADVEDGMTIAREEIFGPVLSVLPYDDEDDLVARANATEYGLAASIWTDDLSTAHRLAAQIDAGTVYVNMLPLLDPAAVHGGFGASGYGLELGPASIDEFTQTKGVWISL
jgi:acyl-CoA reductase-like NAD-dependent aldehyde dehydrogenase